ncbi:hypothetical protein KAU11_04475 [Candidatus Babeliales bacterium]|nr:hypothetical protein [Candidatus Babeliales bacterium]
MSNMEQRIKFDHEKNVVDLTYIKPELLMLLAFIEKWCQLNSIRFHITSVIRTKAQDKRLGARSSTHQEGRAFDFSIKKSHGWDEEKIERITRDLNTLVSSKFIDGRHPNPFYNVGAISMATKSQRVIYVHSNHDGYGNHAHVQVRRT